MRRTTLALLIALSLIGLADALYLAKSAATDTPLVCDLGTGLDGCNVVAQSPYSQVFGIPLADLGVAFYALLLVLSLAFLRYPKLAVSRALITVAILGALLSIGFLYIQFALIKALCIYCILSAALSFLSVPLAFRLKPAAAVVA